MTRQYIYDIHNICLYVIEILMHDLRMINFKVNKEDILIKTNGISLCASEDFFFMSN